MLIGFSDDKAEMKHAVFCLWERRPRSLFQTQSRTPPSLTSLAQLCCAFQPAPADTADVLMTSVQQGKTKIFDLTSLKNPAIVLKVWRL